jgi:adenosylcobinamide kinase/adenosylcobinamide-phosphate guanylyltransferase
MTRISLILGGARSGKTKRALELAAYFSPKTYIATAEAGDGEMADRIAHHRRERGADWRTIEAPLALTEALRVLEDGGRGVCVVDCLTLWLANLMEADEDIEARASELLAALPSVQPSVIFVSNEVGLGIVPDTPLGRHFRDAQGRLNQKMAAAADRVELMVAGLSIPIKVASVSGE